MSYFPDPHTNKNKIEFELDLSNYATKSDLKWALIHHNKMSYNKIHHNKMIRC